MPKIGKYELVRKLATGGMAEVFLARVEWARGLEKTVVVKRILQHLAEDPGFIEMFFSEAQLAAQLNHPNIAQIIEFGESDGSSFLAMEYVDGPSLRALSAAVAKTGDSFPIGPAVRIVAAACEALAYAHELTDPKTGEPLQLVHRDVSPDNILISRNGAVKLVDFGIAKAVTQAHHTKTGLVKGKLPYMSPEQLRADPLDRRTDIFALGVVLYELLAGARPYQAKNDITLIHAMLFEEGSPLQSKRPDCPEALVKIVDRAREKDQERRYPDCQTMYDDLERFLVSFGGLASHFQIAELVRRYTPAESMTQATPPRPFEPMAQTDAVQPIAPVPALATVEIPVAPKTAEVDKAATAVAAPVPVVQPSRSRRRVVAVAIAGLAVAAGAGVLLARERPPLPAPVAPPVAVAPPPAAPTTDEVKHQTAKVALDQAQKLLKDREWLKAEGALLGCLALEEENIECLYALGTLYRTRLHNPERAALHLRKFLDLAPANDPRGAEVRPLLADSRGAANRNVRPAVAVTPAPEMKPASAGPPVAEVKSQPSTDAGAPAGRVQTEQPARVEAQQMYEGGKELLKQKRYRDAQVMFARCLWMDAHYAECHLGLGVAYANLNEPDSSTEHYREFLRLAPDHKRAPEVRKLLEDYEARQHKAPDEEAH